MLYDSLLLSCGGGIIGETSKSKQYAGSAALAIGIGGTGVAALSELKGKIYQQLHPDNPGEPIPKYDGIQLLAIDSDETDYKKYRGNCRLRDDEFFSISNTRLDELLRAKGQIKDNPLMNWMEIDKINERLSPEGAGGVRQIGRFLLMSKASELDTKIHGKCQTALRARGRDSLDIYIFAGISGGTGSGCFLDVCYIVRKIIKRNGWNAKIMGYFFLPDVVTNKPEVSSKPASVAYNNSNGYAAMKELDYLMSLKSANDRFVQNYGGTLQVNTQEAPVDMCHLISAVKADGSMVPNGFSYGINVASDYVMAYLADVDLEGQGDESGMTMRGHLSNVNRGVDTLSKSYGANLSYHVLGACNAEIPMSQINTYLAAGFYAKFMKAIAGETISVTKSSVTDLAKVLKLGANDVLKSVIAGSPALKIPPIDRKILSNSAKPAKGYLNEGWAHVGNDWLDKCSGKMTANANGLTQKLDNFDYNKANEESLLGRLFRKLWEFSVDPQFGPYYAAQLLHNGSYDLISELDGVIKTTVERIATNEMYFEDAKKYLEQCKDDFFKSSSKKNYESYANAVMQYFATQNAVIQQKRTAEVLRQYKKLVQDLYITYFKPLQDMLDNLKESFRENQIFLTLNKGDEASASTYTWQILTLEDIKFRLDEAIENLTAKELVNDFVANLLKNSDSWINSDSDKISLLIRRLMLEQFKKETDRSLQNYLFDKYPGTQGDVVRLAESVKEDILDRVHRSAIPMFWCDPTFKISSPDNSFANSSISVPADASAVCSAADNFKECNKEYVVRKTGIGDRIFALRLYSGIPLYAYQGITLLKSYYDSAEETAAGVGNHLYAFTKRGEDGSGMKDWLHFLPTPMPYSKVRNDNPSLIPKGEDLLELYEQGEAHHIIAQDESQSFAIMKSPAVEVENYSLADFMEDNRFNKGAYDRALARLQGLLDGLHKVENCETISLKNDGKKELGDAVVQRVRRDYFIHYPILQQVVREEIAKRERVQSSIDSLKAVLAEHDVYERELSSFCNLIFFKHLICENSMEQEDYNKIAVIYCTYIDKYQDERRFEFSAKKDSMKFGKTYPLYQAFLTYRGLDSRKTPRLELDKAVNERVSRAIKLEDLCVAYDLEQLWTAHAIDQLTEELVSESEEDKAAILRFYTGLRRNITTMKDDTPVWLNAQTRAELTDKRPETKEVTATAAVAAPPAPDAYWHVWDPQTQKTLVVYAQYGSRIAYDATTGSWINVHAGMMVWNGQAWAPLKTDSFFAEN